MSTNLTPGVTLSVNLGSESDAMDYMAEIVLMDPPKEAIEEEAKTQADSGSGFAAIVATAMFYINQL